MKKQKKRLSSFSNYLPESAVPIIFMSFTWLSMKKLYQWKIMPEKNRKLSYVWGI